MKLYGANKCETLICRYRCCGSVLTKFPNQTNPHKRHKRSARKRARQKGNKQIRDIFINEILNICS